MFTLWGAKQKGFCDGSTRRGFLKAGALGCAGLSLADLLCLRAQAAPAAEATARGKSVIMVWLPGGPSHIDSYDMKPDAPPEFRGEFKPIQTNVPGIQLCELMPLQARIADKLSILRGLRMGYLDHPNVCEIVTGYPPTLPLRDIDRPPFNPRPSFGSVVSRLRAEGTSGLPAYVSLWKPGVFGTQELPSYAGYGHRPFFPTGPGLENLRLHGDVSLERLNDRKQLLLSFDTLRRDLDTRGDCAGMDQFTVQAFDTITSSRARAAFDLSREPDKVHTKYGRGQVPPSPYGGYDTFESRFLQARRLVEAGVSVVTLAVGGWDHHGAVSDIFKDLRDLLPRLDRSLYALLTDLTDRGLEQDVAVVVWGEFGRAPRIETPGKNGIHYNGRNHWPDASIALFAGGGLKMGQVVGATDNRGGRNKGMPYTPQNVLATLYQFLDIDPSQMLADHQGRPVALLDDCKPIAELL
jgi:hypothetical protein